MLKGQLVQAQTKPAKLPDYLDDAVDDEVAFLHATDNDDEQLGSSKLYSCHRSLGVWGEEQKIPELFVTP